MTTPAVQAYATPTLILAHMFPVVCSNNQYYYRIIDEWYQVQVRSTLFTGCLAIDQ